MRRLVPIFIVVVVAAGPALSQELEPRLYSNAPRGLNFLGLAYGYSSGNVFFDTNLPIEDATGTLNTILVRYVRTLGIAGKAAKIDVILPFATGHWEGVLDGEFRTRDARGLGDPRVRLSVNFKGAPAVDRASFGRYKQGTIVGASLQVIVPFGQYDDTKLINLGSNRWTIRPEIGVSHAFGKWLVEGAVAGWWFGKNDDFYGGSTLQQDPFFAIQAHVVYTFKPGLWISFNAGYGNGGRTTLDSETKDTLQINTRFGATFAWPLGRRDGLRVGVASGLTSRVGADFDTAYVAWQHMW